MVPSERCFYQLCIGELVIVLAGLVSIPAAVALQVLVPLAVFRELLLPHSAFHPVPFVASLALGTLAGTGLLLSFRHTTIPLLLLAMFATLALFSLILAETRLQRRYGGTP